MRERFAHEFLKDGRPNPAARRAGYTAKSAGSKLIGLEDVQARIRTLHRSQMRRLQMEADEVVMAWSRIAQFDVATIMAADGSILPVQQWPRDARLCVQSIDIVEQKGVTIEHADGRKETLPPCRVHKIKFNDRMDALANLGRHHNLFAKEAQDVGRGMTQGFAELVERAQASGGGVMGLLSEDETVVSVQPAALGQDA